MRILPDPADAQHDLFDAGRRIAKDRFEAFDARGLVLGKRVHLVVRVAQEGATRVRVRVDGVDAGAFDVQRTNGWEEHAFLVEASFVRSDKIRFELTNEGPADFVDYHVWITQ